ncbi:uncharacterized protein I206_104852 [Kwoniella pini CBS 10737]|uniref:Glycosyl transferase CAP10 domain-containing protein n=1 Tax=Kwoniella pini CBS 10737 TaxID=1296096 RepID=A0A1B9I818_9TREE|nr:uncharacterized protein I206_02392 [Kwoniella pini CBS 10737]OCF51677.1 hypothetical protein I206_02392 [Kwoniella pini CBS 10737]
MDRAQPSPRVPYRATSTPPRTPLSLPSVPGYRGPISPPPINNLQREYPESPTSGISFNSRSKESYIKPSNFSLTGQPPPPPWKKRYLPRSFRSPKRALISLLFLGILILTTRTLFHYLKDKKIIHSLRRNGKFNWNNIVSEGINNQEEEVVEEEEYDDGLCKFVSPVEAYHRDLNRLRNIFPNNNELNSKHQHQHQKHNISHNHYTYSPTGHLIINLNSDDEREDGSRLHPIPLLLNLGEKRWEELLSRQSRTLEEAVREYIRRYGRKPPKGFDKWWEFASKNNLVLPDEYDRINLDLAPFFALPKSEMKRRMEWVENMEKTFTLIIEDGEIEIEIRDPGGLNWGGTLPRAHETSALLKGFSKYLPNMKATFSIFDQPQIYLSWARRGSLIDLGLRGEVTTHLKETDNSEVKLSRSCAPGTNFRKNKEFIEGKSFIYDSLEAGDPCQNPYLIPVHGLTLEPHGHDSLPKPHTQLLPLFSLAKTSINSDILVTPTDQFDFAIGKDPVWEEKDNDKLVWRGSSTGISMMNSSIPWRQAHRIRLHHFAANTSTDSMSYLIPDLGQPSRSSSRRLEDDGQLGDNKQYHASSQSGAKRNINDPLTFTQDEVATDEAMDFFYDIKLSGGPIQCDTEDGTCDDMQKEIQWAGHQSADELNRHKFLLDIDGNGWSGRFRRLMSTNSMVIKMTMFTEWFQPHLIPWFMYVPAKLDFSDLTDIMAFFRGTPKYPELGFDETAAALARNGQCFVQRMFRMEDLQAYMMRLFLEYARIAADEGIDMDFSIEEIENISSEWNESDKYEKEEEDRNLEEYPTDSSSPSPEEEAKDEYGTQVEEFSQVDQEGIEVNREESEI